MDTYISKLAPKTLLRMIKHAGQQGIPGNVQQAFNVSRRHFLKSFPPPEIKERKIPKLNVTVFTINGDISNVVPSRGLLMLPNILSNIPPSCRAFRECILHQQAGLPRTADPVIVIHFVPKVNCSPLKIQGGYKLFCIAPQPWFPLAPCGKVHVLSL